MLNNLDKYFSKRKGKWRLGRIGIGNSDEKGQEKRMKKNRKKSRIGEEEYSNILDVFQRK